MHSFLSEVSTSSPTSYDTTPRIKSPSPSLHRGSHGEEDTTPSLIPQRTTSTSLPHSDLAPWRKCLVVFVTSFTTLSVTFASTSLFPLTAEVAASLGTTAASITVVNALVLFTMGCSGFVWGPVGRQFGRKSAWLAASAVFLLCTVGTGLAPRARSKPAAFRIFVAMRILSGVQGTFFHVAGQTWLADIFVPTQRGTATGFFLVGSVFGPAFGPCISGIMTTFTHWQAILWLQTAMIGVGMILSMIFLPDIRTEENTDTHGFKQKLIAFLKDTNPAKVFRVMFLPNVFLTDLTCGLLSWCQYTLLAAPRHLLNPRFGLTTPLVSGLFYIAPGVGFLLGTVVGGRLSDMTVKKWITTRDGLRLPQDRLHSSLISFFFITPVSSLIYGWGLQYRVGGLALPIVTAFFCGAGLLMAFASVNTYCAEVLPKRRTEVIASKYLIQYTFASAGSAAMVPLIDAIGIGPASTIGVAFIILGGVLTLITAKFGLQMQRSVEKRGGFYRNSK
ncbi:major facilitator superfamily domain-containing protein [Biscogniauxia sp. FL1348]|nr:major facilitator superfamily domain-containing protein [Biscogniauxia sp. FL1348]